MLERDQRLCLLPLARVLVEDPFWISEAVAVFPPDALTGETLRTVGWPERDYQQTLGRSGTVILSGDALHWAKSGATRIDLPDFFGSALLALPVAIDWDAFLEPESHEAHLDMLTAAMEEAEQRDQNLTGRKRPNTGHEARPNRTPSRIDLLRAA